MKFAELAKNFSRRNLPESEVEFIGTIPAEEVASYRDKALGHIAEHLELPGFRPGKVPRDMALKKVGDMAVLEEAVEMLVKEFYPALIEEHKVDAVGRPDIRITKLAPGIPVELTIHLTLYPELSLPKNWKNVGESVALEPALPATEKEIDETLESLKKSRKAEVIDDEFAKSLGAFNTLEELRAQIKKGIDEEKARASRDARRGKIIDRLLDDVNVAVPKLFIESELEKIMAQMREDVARFGMKFEDYLKQSGKTEEGVRNEFRDQAKKRAKLQLTLNKIAAEEKLEPDHTAVEAELKHAIEHFPDANPELVRVHIETVLRNDMALRLLEEAGKKE